MPQRGVRVSPDELAALKELVLAGGRDRGVKISSDDFAELIGVARQTAVRWLQSLEEADFVERDVVSDGQWISITDDGQHALRREYEMYWELFDSEEKTALRGRVTSGMGEGCHYISLSGYVTQFREQLGYEPFPGTLNVELTSESRRRRAIFERIDPVPIDGWEDEERTYGPSKAYPVVLEAGGDRYETAHVIEPERTHHGESQMEIIAPERLRGVLDIDDGQEVTVYVG